MMSNECAVCGVAESTVVCECQTEQYCTEQCRDTDAQAHTGECVNYLLRSLQLQKEATTRLQAVQGRNPGRDVVQAEAVCITHRKSTDTGTSKARARVVHDSWFFCTV